MIHKKTEPATTVEGKAGSVIHCYFGLYQSHNSRVLQISDSIIYKTPCDICLGRDDEVYIFVGHFNDSDSQVQVDGYIIYFCASMLLLRIVI